MYKIVTYWGLSSKGGLLLVSCFLDNVLRVCKDVVVCVFEAI